ncbi:hypothetical protein TrVE_jg6401 [Triparma verrucosa]|uniref:U-box domain-containing protein n=1 Tax=Triparma verrucosa TaxID=1606542 RepID=A0A9W7CDE5_9STRA|nr:hypothetical protein TrVE_jg6401 [Triparma verrucosa]
MGRFSALCSNLKSESTRVDAIKAICDASGPRTFKKEEVGINEKDMYNETGIVEEIIKLLTDEEAGCQAPAADTLFRMSRDNEVKTLMSQNSPLLTAISTILLTIPDTPIANNCCLCLQNVSFPAETRETLLNINGGKIVEGLAHVVSCPATDAHQKSRETALAVLSNMAITPACKHGLFEFQSGKLIKNLIGVINIGDKESNNVLAREKALTLCKNIANHQRTKQPMFEFPGMVTALTNVLTQALSNSKSHKEIALQVFQNIANNDATPDKMLNTSGLVSSIVAVIAAKANDSNETARTNACLVLQNISFIEPCREKLYNYPGFFEALVSVLSNEEDTVKKNALPVLLNTSMATTVRVSMFKHRAFIPSLVKLASNETGVVREKSLSVLRNVANHEETKSPMFEHPEMIDTLMGVINTPLDDGTKLARETALAVIQNISNNDVNPSRLIAKEGLMNTLYDVFRQSATEKNKVARENSLLVCQNLSFPNTTRAPLFQFDNGRFFDAILDVMYDESNQHNKVASEKALATIANMSNKKENNLPMVQNSRFINKLVELCGTTGEPKRQSINILAKIAAGALFTAPYLLRAKGDLLSVMMAVVRDVGTDLKKWKKGNSNEFWALTFLMNLAQAEFSVPYMRVANVTKLMAPLVSQTSKESLQASATVAYLVGGDEDGEIYDLLSSNLSSIDRIIDLLENTLNCKGDGKGENGKNLDYGYGVFPLHSPLRAVKVLAKTDGFKSYLLDKGVYAKLHRCLRDFVESTGGGYVGGGGEDVESASLAVDALLELSYPSKNGELANDKSAALHIVEKFSDSNMTSMPSLLEQYEMNYKVKTSEFFSSSVMSANSLSNRINLSSATKTTEMAAKMWKMATMKKQASLKEGLDRNKQASIEERQAEDLQNEEAKTKIEEATRLMEKQQKQFQIEQQKREHDLKVLEQALKNEKDSNQRKIVEMQKALAEKENAKNVFRADDLAQQLNSMKVQLSLHTKTDNIALDVQEVKGAMKQALSSLENFFTGESPVPRYIIMGPARGTTLSKDGLMSFMTKKQTATLHVLCSYDLSTAVSFDISEPASWIRDCAPALRVGLTALKFAAIGAKLTVGLPFLLPEGVDLEMFLGAGISQIDGSFGLDTDESKILKEIDSGGRPNQRGMEITGAAYAKLKEFFADPEKMRKLTRTMDKVRNKTGKEEWISVRNLDAYCEANSSEEVEIVVASPIKQSRPSSMSMPTAVPTMPTPSAPLTPSELVREPEITYSPTNPASSSPPNPPQPRQSFDGGVRTDQSLTHTREILELKMEVMSLKAEMAGMRREFAQGMAAILTKLEAPTPKPKRKKSFFGGLG